LSRLQRNVVIRAPAERVWSVLVDPQRSTDWEAGLVGVKDARGPLDEPEASCTQVMNFRGRALEGELQVIEAFPPHTRVVRFQPPLTAKAVRRERLVATDDGTQLTIELSYKTRGGPLGAVLNVAITRPRLAMMIAESLRKLRRLVESEHEAGLTSYER
jgi:uncharacterized protein YndB with AHSA1/START domain